jgi:acetyltransferase-like isoleucine patch superfamily enzyme
VRSDFLYLWRNRERPADPGRKLKVWLKRLYHLKSTFILLLKPAVLRRRGATIGERVIVGRALISGNWSALAIGDESSLGRCEISLQDRVTIGRRVAINDGAIILTASHSVRHPGWPTTRAPVVIGDYAWVATGAIILPGVSIGRGAVVGAGAVVRQDVPPYAVAIGNPAQILSHRRVKELDYSPVLLNAPFEAWTGPRKHGNAAGSP